MIIKHDKFRLQEIIDNSDLSQYLNQFNQFIDNDKYYTIQSINQISNVAKADLSIFHLNIRSLNKHADDLVNLLSSLKISFDCVCLTEIGSTNLDIYASLLNGYQFHKIPPMNNNKGGVGIYVKQNIKVEIIKELELQCKDPCENVWLSLKHENKETLLGVIYRHPNGGIADFSDQLEKILTKLQMLKRDQIVITGDINIDLIKYSQSGMGKIKGYLDLMLTNGFLPGNVLPSRVTNHTATLIDHVFLNERRQSSKVISGNLFTDISDHFASFLLTFQNNRKDGLDKRAKVRIFGDKNTQRFIQNLRNTNMEAVYSSTDANECTEAFTEIIQNAYNRSFPLKTVSNKRAVDKPWMSTALRKSILKKNKLFSKYIKNKNPENKTNYIKYRNILTCCLRQAKNSYYREIFNNKATRITKMWKVLGKMINPKSNKKTSTIKRIVLDNKCHENDTDIANALNKHFCSVGDNIANKIDAAKTHFSAFLQNPSPNTFFLKQVEEYEVLQQIQNLKLKKSPGHDGIKPSIIKAAYEILVRPLTHLYNVSLSSGIVPNIWKIAKVIPIFKKGELSFLKITGQSLYYHALKRSWRS